MGACVDTREKTKGESSIKTESFKRKERLFTNLQSRDTIFSRVKKFLVEWYDLIGDFHPDTGKIIVGHIVCLSEPSLLNSTIDMIK